MASKLSRFINLTQEQACEQWGQIAAREWRKRQENFKPVEVLLGFGLFYIVNPHSYGGANIDSAPEAVQQLARTCKRTPGSILSKMLNLDGSRKNSGRLEPELFIRLSEQPELYMGLYCILVQAARSYGFDASQVPDFLDVVDKGQFTLAGQEELGSGELEKAIEEHHDKIDEMACNFGMETKETTRLVLQKVRIGQHRFANQVMNNYGHTCAFCGFSLGDTLKGMRLLHASHIKPWRECNDRERLDVRNGIAACAIHDAAFDSGLLTINEGLGIQMAQELQAKILKDERAMLLFGEGIMRNELHPPQGKENPSPKYLSYHNKRVFRGDLSLAY